jgi:Tfp pilus assembly protein PilN
MPQQINLFHPVLLAPRRHFPALAMVQALGLWSGALAALAGWTLWQTQALQAELAGTRARHASERVQLNQALAQRGGAAGDPAALQQELTRLDTRLAERQRVLEELGGAAGGSPTVLLQQLANSLPAPVWLTEIHWAPGQLSLAGQTLEPEALRTWLQGLGPTSSLRVERQAAGGPVWAFRLGQDSPPTAGAAP